MSQIWQQHQHKLEERHKGEHHTRQQLFLLFRVKGYQSSDILVGDISFFVATDQWMNLYDTIHTSAIGGKGLAPITSINILKFIVSSSSLNSVFVVAHIVPDHISLVAVHPNMWKLMNISLICRWHTYYWKYQYSQCQITVISLYFVCVRRIASFQLNTTQLKKLVWSAVNYFQFNWNVLEIDFASVYLIFSALVYTYCVSAVVLYWILLQHLPDCTPLTKFT